MSRVALEGEGAFRGARQGAIRRKERITATLWSVALLLSPGLGLATDIDASSFRCITKMTPVRQFYVDNLQGSLDATLATANSPRGAVYPPGSVIQLIPGEAMVKRDRGFNAATHDWEFLNSTYRRMERELANEEPSMSSIDLAGTVSAATFQLPHSGILSAKPTTVAPRFRIHAP